MVSSSTVYRQFVGETSQEEAPMWLKVPCPHDLQELDPGVAVKVPAAQGAHEDPPPAANCPGGQGAQMEACSSDTKPGGQATHSMAPPSWTPVTYGDIIQSLSLVSNLSYHNRIDQCPVLQKIIDLSEEK